MFDSKTIDSFAEQFSKTIPSGFLSFKEDVEKNLHALLQSTLSKLDLVSREEFEVQKAVLAKTRCRLEELEKRVAELEQRILPE
ncbi:MAG: accessory factor UbiK family protein [Methylomonas sp.]|jgi:BMFP domain-containing protein YqiC